MPRPRSYSMKMVEDRRAGCFGGPGKFVVFIFVVIVILALLAQRV